MLHNSRARPARKSVERLFGEPVQSACFGVLLDLFVEAGSVEGFEPRPELGQLIRGQFA